MPLTPKAFKTALKQAISENGLTITFAGNDVFNLIRNNEFLISTQLLISNRISARHGSHNGNETHGIGVFKFNLPTLDLMPDYFVMAFENTFTGSAEFVIIGYDDFIQRLTKRNRIKENKAETWLWLMPDRCVYDCTDISIEGEWYYLSKGAGGRMADDTEMDYSQHLNNWDEIKSQVV